MVARVPLRGRLLDFSFTVHYNLTIFEQNWELVVPANVKILSNVQGVRFCIKKVWEGWILIGFHFIFCMIQRPVLFHQSRVNSGLNRYLLENIQIMGAINC